MNTRHSPTADADTNAVPAATSGGALVWIIGLCVVAMPLVLKSLAQETSGDRRQSAAIVLISLVVIAAGSAILVPRWQWIVNSLGNSGLAIIGMFAALHFAIAHIATIAGYASGIVLGPYSVFIDGIGSEGIACLLLGALITLLPRFGTLSFALLTVFMLNAVTTGTLGLVPMLFVAATIVLYEGFAALFGVTTKWFIPAATIASSRSFLWRVALALGLANAATMYMQYAMFEILLRPYYSLTFKIQVTLVAGFLYGFLGAGCGVMLGYRLRKVSP